MRAARRQHDATDLNWPASISLLNAARGYDVRVIPAQFDETATIKLPKQPRMIHARKLPFAVTAEQIEWPPSERCCAFGPAAVEETPQSSTKRSQRRAGTSAGGLFGSSRANPSPRRAALRNHTDNRDALFPHQSTFRALARNSAQQG